MKRTLKRILSTVLVAVMLVGFAPLTGVDFKAEAANKTYKDGDIIEFGSYPQSRVTDEAIIDGLDSQSLSWKSYNYYSGKGGGSTTKPSDYMKYADIVFNGNKYRAVTFSKYRPSWTGDISSSSNTRQDDNGYYTGNVYYFKYEPLKWRVLDASTGLVVCDSIIDSQAYNNYRLYSNVHSNGECYGDSGKNHYASDWENSSLRKWLNEDFYNTAFSKLQQDRIQKLTRENKSECDSKYDSNPTSDKITLLSYWYAWNIRYGFGPSRPRGTDYAKCQGLRVNTSSDYGGTSPCWLRSPGYSGDAMQVDRDGCWYRNDLVNYTDLGIVPAFNFNPKSTIPDGETFKMVNNEVAMKCDFEYTDDFFNQSAYNYNHKLAIASCCFATSAMVKDGAPFNDPESAKTMLKTIGFGNNDGEAVSCYGYQKSPTMNSIACVVSNKNIGDTSIIAVAVRGGGYEGEWAGNFNVGNGTNHAGFDVAKQQVCDNIIKFMNQDGVTLNKNVKFWITGYSRAAATANLLAADVNNKKLVGTSACYDLNDYNYSADNVFAYCFETPRNTRDKNAKNATYNNIFNIVNRIDPVPRVAPAAWSYVRYGKDCYLPSKETYNPKAYSSLVDKVSNNFDKIYTGKGDKSYKEDFKFYEFKFNYKLISITHIDVSIIENKSISQGVFWDNFVKYLADGLKSPEYYAANYQNGLTKAVYKLKGNIKYDEILQQRDFWDYIYDQISVKYILKNLIVTSSVLDNVITEALMIYFADAGMTRADATDIAGALSGVLAKMASHPNYLLTAIKNGDQLFLPHYTETTLAWLKTLDGDFAEANAAVSKMLTGGEKYRVATINCPVNVKVYDSDGNLCGSIINNEVQYIENGISVYVNDNGEKCFCLPEDEEFRFEYTGYDDGTLNCSFAEVDAATGEKLTSKNYYDMPLSNGKTYTGILEEKVDDEIDAVVIDSNNETIQSDETVDFKTAEKFNITVSADESMGMALGGGKFTKSEFCQITALPNKGYMFKGWYSGDKLISTELQYKFIVTDNMVVTARFELILGDINTDGRINSADALLALQSSTGMITLTDTQKLLADVNTDGRINSTDALLILQYATGKVTSFK